MRLHPRRSSLDGFTLLEAMVMVAIVGISAALAAPAMMNAIANRRAGEGVHAVVRIGARARSEAIGYGRAHVLTFSDSSTGAGDMGTLELWRGTFDRCSANNWASIITSTCAGNRDCVDSLDMGTYTHPTNSAELRLMPAGTGGSLCFQPNGDVYFAAAGGLWSTTPPAGSDAMEFRVRRINHGSPAGVDRFVVFPFGGTPRIRR